MTSSPVVTDPSLSALSSWPVPPYVDVIQKVREEGETFLPCLVELGGGRRINTNLVHFDIDAMSIEVQHDKTKNPFAIPFSSFRGLLLSEPVELKRISLEAQAHGMAFADVDLSTKRQKCSIEFKDGSKLEVEVMGFIPHPAGLFLYMVQYGNQFIRGFYAAHAVANYHIGEKIGKLLLEQHLVSPDSVVEGLKKQETMRSQKLGDYLKLNQVVTQEQVEAALERQRRMPQIRLGDALVQEGVINESQLKQALETQARDRKQQLGSILIGMGVVGKEVINRVLAQKLGIPFVSLTHFRFDPDLLKSVPVNLIRQHNVMPLFRSGNRLAVAIENPLATTPLQELSFATHLKVEPVMAAPDELREAIRRYYDADSERESLKSLVSQLDSTKNDFAATAEIETFTDSDNTLVRLVNQIIMDAYRRGASDIHIETGKGGNRTKIRFRKDGVMVPYSDIPPAYRSTLISRIKIMAVLDISEKRHSQDGKIDFSHPGGVPIELRVVTIPTMDGLEDVVMRILSKPVAMSPDQLDLNPVLLEQLKSLVVKPYGLILVCGPTGSGKTTTLHSLLSHINTPERKIWTVEDPVEITQEGLRQVQVQSKIDWTFPAVLRSFLRADPDVIMVGETRDAETAKTVIEASLTGHLVLSTLHTNSAVESVVRLLDLGMDPFNFSDALLGILGQRLVRRLCRSCRRPYKAAEDELHLLASAYCGETGGDVGQTLLDWNKQYASGASGITLYKPCGCEKCSQSGYSGRIGVFELLVNTPSVKRHIYNKASVLDLLALAISEGYKTIRQDAIEKILAGETDWKQVQMV
jgi:type II secretory ATPase GspE/PulE/Tfp pilus assembly ATPase PilB-like protein